jgi:DNA-3-methyladenine glycosylase
VKKMSSETNRVSQERVTRPFFDRDTLSVAQDLIGLHLCVRTQCGLRVGRIVETEAYQGPEDLAAHSRGGKMTARTEAMFGPPGHAYVYLIYGVWHCLNFVTREVGTPHAVLLRAVEPIAGLLGKTNGPGLLCRSFDIDLRHNGMDLEGDTLWLEKPVDYATPTIVASARIGIGDRGQYTSVPWRFHDATSKHVSKR